MSSINHYNLELLKFYPIFYFQSGTNHPNLNFTMTHDPFIADLQAVPRTRQLVAEELRAMAEAIRRPYQQFAAIDPWIRNIWNAAADFIEGKEL